MKKFALFTLFLLSVCTLTLMAQDADQAASSGDSFFVIFFLSGGTFLGIVTTVPIVIMNFISIALIIEGVFSLKRDSMAPPEMVVELEELIDQGQYDEAISLCEQSRNFVTNVVGAALLKVNSGQEAMTSAAESQVVEENTKLSHKISWINLLGNLGPMLGLFGTVVGMVDAFTKIATSTQQPSPKELAGGIYTALITTIWGLIVSMPALTAYFVFKNRVQKLSLELTSIAGELIEKCKPSKASR